MGMALKKVGLRRRVVRCANGSARWAGLRSGTSLRGMAAQVQWRGWLAALWYLLDKGFHSPTASDLLLAVAQK